MLDLNIFKEIWGEVSKNRPFSLGGMRSFEENNGKWGKLKSSEEAWMSAMFGGEIMPYQMSNRINMKFPLPNAACRATANKWFSYITGNFIIATTTKK